MEAAAEVESGAETFGERLRRMRLARGLSQAQLFYLTGIPKEQISRIENNHVRMPRLSTVVALARGMRCTIDELA